MAIDSSSSTTASLAPGFRFHPTDEELVRYYLRRKICGKSFRFDAISEVDIYKVEPWDLPGKSRLKTRDLEWYFFSVLDKKYGNGSRTNRATDRGYWKTTGKDRPVYHKSQIVGMKKTLVFHSGRAPSGERSNWVMHEYRLIDEELEKSGIVQDAFVLCRIFRKSGSGPKNGEQYGAPFVEEEWEDDELAMVPKEESAEEVPVGDGAYLDENDLEQILGTGTLSENAPLPLNFCYGDNGNFVQEFADFSDDAQKLLVGMSENHHGPEQPDAPKLFDLPVQYDMDTKSVKREYIGETSNNANSVDVDYLLDGRETSNNANSVDVDYLLDEPFLDATDSLPFDDGSFLETNDLTNPVEADPSGFDMLEEYLTYFDAADDQSKYLTFDSSKMMGGEDFVYDPASLTNESLPEGKQATMASQQLLGHDNDIASSSKQERSNFGSDIKYPFMNLGNIPAPPAFASEFPTKDTVLRLNSASRASSSVHVTAGMIQISNVTSSGNGIDWSFGKHGHINIIFSFGLSQGDDNSAISQPGKANSAIFRGWFCFMFLWVLILSMSFKIGTYICAR